MIYPKYTYSILYYKKQIIIIGYSGHAYVILETINSLNHQVIGYIEPTIKKKKPYDIPYLGNDNTLSEIKDNYFFQQRINWYYA